MDLDRRLRLQRLLEEGLGPETAALLMEHIPPDKWDELATKADLADLATKADLAELVARMDGFESRMDGLEREVAALRAWLGQQFEIVEQRREATEHRILGAIRSEMAALVSTQTRTIVIALVAAITANSGLVLAATRMS